MACYSAAARCSGADGSNRACIIAYYDWTGGSGRRSSISITGRPITLGLDGPDSTLLALTFAISIVTFGAGPTNILPGRVHLLLFLGPPYSSSSSRDERARGSKQPSDLVIMTLE